LSSMFLTIILVPMMYYTVDRIKDKIAFRKNKKIQVLDEVLS
jgi:hypothetical protein